MRIIIDMLSYFAMEWEGMIFLCSDGVYPCMALEILRDRMMDDKPLEEIMDTFKFMCEKFSRDNYSGIMIRID
jgi:predicted peroxiredoxin